MTIGKCLICIVYIHVIYACNGHGDKYIIIITHWRQN